MLSTIEPENQMARGLPSSRTFKPPFGYYGSKHRIAARIASTLPPHTAWVEAFCGSASLTFAKRPAEIEIINDLDGEIVNLFDQLRDNTEELCRQVALTPYARAELARAKDQSQDLAPVERARRFLVRCMMTVNGSVGSPGNSGFSFSQSYARMGKEARVSRWYNLPDRLVDVVERLRGVRVENRDARELLEMFQDRPGTLVYLDPPYFVEREHTYSFDANNEQFHRELLEKCNESRAMILLSGYQNPLYSDILKKANGWTMQRIQTSTRATSGKDFSRTEVLWKNEQYSIAERNRKVPLDLSAKEIKEHKINPSR